MNILQFFREKFLSVSSSFAGVLGFLGGYQICHNICLGLIALLSLIGITLVGMPLLFLTKVAIPFWIAAATLFLVAFGFYIKKRCISKNMLLFNGGIIVAGVPFNSVKSFLPFFWIIGGTAILVSCLWFIRDKIRKKRNKTFKYI